jgi:hypothetical protein
MQGGLSVAPPVCFVIRQESSDNIGYETLSTDKELKVRYPLHHS